MSRFRKAEKLITRLHEVAYSYCDDRREMLMQMRQKLITQVEQSSVYSSNNAARALNALKGVMHEARMMVRTYGPLAPNSPVASRKRSRNCTNAAGMRLSYKAPAKPKKTRTKPRSQWNPALRRHTRAPRHERPTTARRHDNDAGPEGPVCYLAVMFTRLSPRRTVWREDSPLVMVPMRMLAGAWQQVRRAWP